MEREDVEYVLERMRVLLRFLQRLNCHVSVSTVTATTAVPLQLPPSSLGVTVLPPIATTALWQPLSRDLLADPRHLIELPFPALYLSEISPQLNVCERSERVAAEAGAGGPYNFLRLMGREA